MRGNWLRKPWVWVLIAIAALTILFTLLPGGSSTEDVPLTMFIDDVKAGAVVRVEVDEQEIEYEVAGGDHTFSAEMERDDTVRQVLQDAGVEPEDFPPITPRDRSRWSRIPLLVIAFLPLILFIAILFAILRWIWSKAGTKGKGRDPVCGRRVRPSDAAGISTFQEISYRFCSPECKQRFDADPVSYLLKS